MRIIWVTLALLVYVSACLPEVAQSQDTRATSVEIQMTSSGYEPATVEVAPGTEVIFINADTEDFWPATDHHPTHTLYDGTSLEEHCGAEQNDAFDACKAMKPGERWSFTFKTAGTFMYHDHLWPHLKGYITVRENETLPPTASYIDRFIAFSNKLFTLVKETFFVNQTRKTIESKLPSDPYVRKVVESDPRWAIETLRQDTASSGELFARCHEVLHDIGKEAFYQYGSFGAASVFQSDFCNSGYIHGVFEAYFLAVGDPTLGLTEACDNYATLGGRPFDRWQCHHGVGHGFMYFTGGDVQPALTLCQDTFETDNAVDECQNGVYMELFNTETLAKESEYLDVADPSKICQPMTESRGDCYHYLPTYLFHKLSLAEIFSVCGTIPVEHFDSCKLGAGAEAMKRSMQQPQAVFLMCSELASLRDQTVCVAGAVSMYMNQTASLTDSYQLCEKIPEMYHNACLQVVDSRVSDFKPTQ